jgi:hypothetical protein
VNLHGTMVRDTSNEQLNEILVIVTNVESCSHEKDYSHNNGIVARHILLHD